MPEHRPLGRHTWIDVTLVAVGVLAVFAVDLVSDIPVGVSAGYALFILIGMLVERVALILWTGAASLVLLATASLADPHSATFTLTGGDFVFNRSAQALGIVLVVILAVVGVRRREALARRASTLSSSVHELEYTTQELRDEQARLVALAESMPVPVWLSDASSAINYISEGMRTYLGTAPRDRADWLAVVHPDDRSDLVDVVDQALPAGQSYEIEIRLRRHDGAYRAHLIRATPLAQAVPASMGTQHQWWSTATDIEELRQSQRDAAQLAREHLDTLESIDDGVITYTSDLHFAYVNPAAARMFGTSPAELVGRHVWEAYPHVRTSEVGDAFDSVRRTGEPVHLTQHATTIDKWFALTISSAPAGFTAYVKDITEIREMSQRLERANRLESVGSLTGGIAHDFNNLLTVIIGGAEALAEEDLTEPAEQMRAMIAEAADRGSNLIRALLAFARRQTLHPEPTDIADALAALRPLLDRTLGGAVTVRLDIADGLPPVMVDRGKLDNAMLNLAINARDAMPDGGFVSVSAARVTPHEASRAGDVDLPAGDYVRVSVTDTGIGIGPEALPRLFEPFYTTKPTGGGSGLGLAMAWGFASQSGGTLTVDSEPGRGSEFALYLPVAGAEPRAVVPPARAVPVTGSGTVLLVEDDELVRGYTATRLASLGYDVLEASDGRRALEILDTTDDVALLLTDMVMPGGMSGQELAHEARVRRPRLPVLCVSGYTDNVLAADGRIDPDAELLTKPYTVHQLAERVARLVSQEGSVE
ncbi:hybrid sensor histidine kinase/response regulator [Demequina capsici]|uniref:histidine kinase n=1 Tax=Demequina capsici TaxID=3075620 RepID=A0AA96F9Q8_9MICO|nr:ATP-binding protein [Demequina sp. OYTSA14]WNM25330.1 PAS domain S-box protein [Demequina sp. OYTSA14]